MPYLIEVPIGHDGQVYLVWLWRYFSVCVCVSLCVSVRNARGSHAGNAVLTFGNTGGSRSAPALPGAIAGDYRTDYTTQNGVWVQAGLCDLRYYQIGGGVPGRECNQRWPSTTSQAT